MSTPSRHKPWFQRYDELRADVEQIRNQYRKRCEELGSNFRRLTPHLWQEFVSRAVHESNWQEGIRIDEGRSFELTDKAFEFISGISGPHLTLDGILRAHVGVVKNLKGKRTSVDEIAAFNLSAAHHCISLLVYEMATRRLALGRKAIQKLADGLKEQIAQSDTYVAPLEAQIKDLDGFLKQEELYDAKSPHLAPLLSEKFATQGEYFRALMGLDLDALANPMKVQYLHFLHALVLTGIKSRNEIGAFRKRPISVGLGEVMFPPAALVPKLMENYCRDFPLFRVPIETADPIMLSAEISHRFVRIHPYSDGNGRVSRLLMNLCLNFFDYLPVYLRADGNGSRRYIYSLRRANNGDLKSLAALIAQQLKEVYTIALKAIPVE